MDPRAHCHILAVINAFVKAAANYRRFLYKKGNVETYQGCRKKSSFLSDRAPPPLPSLDKGHLDAHFGRFSDCFWINRKSKETIQLQKVSQSVLFPQLGFKTSAT